MPLPGVAGRLPVGDLLGSLSSESRHALGRQRHTPGRALSLRRDDQQFPAHPLKRLPDGDDAFVQVHVRPAQDQHLTASQTDADRQFVRGPQPVGSSRSQEPAPFLGRQRFDFLPKSAVM